MEPGFPDCIAEGDAYYEAGRWNEAGAGYERALARQPAGSAHLWYRLGNVREEQGRDEDAVACFERTVALEPNHARAWNNLGGARQRLGHPTAIEAYRRSIAADPDLAQPFLNLGRLHGARGEHALAIECFRAGLARHPGDPSFTHLVAAASGATTERAPRGYVTALFDGLAQNFEQHLVGDLEYHVPGTLAALARPVLKPGMRAVDLGCGTGLVGAALAGSGVNLIGVDLSPRMLEVAAARGHYTQLVLADAVDGLASMPAQSAHAVFAADVFIYVGDLAPMFEAVARALAPAGFFAFSVESLADGDYRLLPTGRYAHSREYLRALAARAGLSERDVLPTPIRREGSDFAQGWLAVFTAA